MFMVFIYVNKNDQGCRNSQCVVLDPICWLLSVVSRCFTRWFQDKKNIGKEKELQFMIPTNKDVKSSFIAARS